MWKYRKISCGISELRKFKSIERVMKAFRIASLAFFLVSHPSLILAHNTAMLICLVNSPKAILTWFFTKTCIYQQVSLQLIFPVWMYAWIGEVPLVTISPKNGVHSCTVYDESLWVLICLWLYDWVNKQHAPLSCNLLGSSLDFHLTYCCLINIGNRQSTFKTIPLHLIPYYQVQWDYMAGSKSTM